jgi:nucleoside-diphosphate-sugar epimerase
MSVGATAFVVGASGYIGGALLNRASERGAVLGTSSSGRGDFLALQLEVPSDFDYTKIHSGDVVFLTAAISAPDICAREYERAWKVNVTGTSAFISQVIDRGARVIFFSSDTVYGECIEAFDERRLCHPAGEYAAMKREVEHRFLRDSLFKVVRLSYVFSREDKFTRYLFGCAERNEEADLFHPFCRAVVYRDDVIDGALALAERWHNFPEQVINFGGPAVISRVEFAECLQKSCLPQLRFTVSEPDSEFFTNRPRIISMKSPIFARLLGREPYSLCQAAQREFGSSS